MLYQFALINDQLNPFLCISTYYVCFNFVCVKSCIALILCIKVSVNCRSNIKSQAGWSIFLCHSSENEFSEQVSENFSNSKFFFWQNFFACNNFCQCYFRQLKKNLSLFADKVFTNKVKNVYWVQRKNFIKSVKN